MIYKKYFISIDRALFKCLEEKVEVYNRHLNEEDGSKIMMDKTVFLIDQILYQKSIRKNDITNGGYIRIPSKILNSYLQKELKKYKDFLKTYGFIKTIPYSTDGSRSYGYKVIYQKSNSETTRHYDVYEFLNFNYEKFLAKSVIKESKIEQKKLSADRSTRHLTKWLNAENISIDWKEGFDFISNSQDLTNDQKEQYSYSLNRMRFGQWYYLRSVNDNRLHSNLTNFPSSLRGYLSHNGNSLVSLDVKSSQPYMLAGVLNFILNKEWEVAKEYLRSKDVKDKFTTVMNSISLSSITIADFRAYQKLICDTDIYNYLGSNLDKTFVKNLKYKNGYQDKIYKPSLGYRVNQYYRDLRGYCKVLMLEYMYCSPKSTLERVKQVKRIFPEALNKFIYDFKHCPEMDKVCNRKSNKRTETERAKIDKSKKLFAKFLQQIEAFILLDIITKELSKLYPNMFMATIHDSIVVPIQYQVEVKEYLKRRLLEIFGLSPEIKNDVW